MSQVRLTYTKGELPQDVGSVLYGISMIPFVRLFLIGQVIKLILKDEDAVEEYHSPNIVKKLNDSGFTIQKSPQYLSKCSIMTRHVNSYILNQQEAELEKTISKDNKVNVFSVTKMPKYKMMKVTCSTPKEACTLESKGARIGNLIIPATDIEFHKFANITQCFRCYGFNHLARDCKKEQVCSKCGETGHFHKACKNDKIRCVNCNEPHLAISLKCTKKRAQTSKNPPTPSTATSTAPIPPKTPLLSTPGNSYATITATPPPNHHITLDSDKQAKIFTLTHVAQAVSNGNRTLFLQYLTEGLRLNNLPTVQFPPSYSNGPGLTLPPYPIPDSSPKIPNPAPTEPAPQLPVPATDQSSMPDLTSSIQPSPSTVDDQTSLPDLNGPIEQSPPVEDDQTSLPDLTISIEPSSPVDDQTSLPDPNPLPDSTIPSTSKTTNPITPTTKTQTHTPLETPKMPAKPPTHTKEQKTPKANHKQEHTYSIPTSKRFIILDSDPDEPNPESTPKPHVMARATPAQPQRYTRSQNK